MTGKKCMMVTEWVLMPAAALKGALALKYRERTNHQWLFHFVLSRRKTYLKNCKAWIRYLKKKISQRKHTADKLGCVPTLSHSLLQQQHNRRWMLRSPTTVLRRSRLCFLQTWQALEHGWILVKGEETTRRTAWEEDGIPSAHLCTPKSGGCSSSVGGDKLFQLLIQSEWEK